jgi:stage II sporulation protein D
MGRREKSMGRREKSMGRRGKSRGEPDLWMGFAGGALTAAIIWFTVHGGGLRQPIENQQPERQTSVEKKEVASVQDKLPDTSRVVNQGNRTNSFAAPDEENNKLSKIQVNLTENQPKVRVYLSQSKTIETVPLEAYVRGVVAAEMPLAFEPAALEAQAMAARTYIIRRLWLNDRTGIPVHDADVTDTQTHQVYRSLSEVKQLQQGNAEGWKKVVDAVSNTAGDIIVYGDEPIEALFFSTSNGFTENSEEVFPAKLPYLRSVESPWDKESSPRAQETIEMRLSDFYNKLGVKAVSVEGKLSKQPILRVIEWTLGHRVKLMLAGSKRLTGEEVRHLLGLRSASFNWTISNNRIILTIYGSGHGVGMSQWGAEGMAKAGKTAEQIVGHYYFGTHIEKVSKLVNSSGKRL